MIVKILQGSSDFHAVRYNDRKVAEGVARLIEKKDFGTLDEATTDDRVNFLKLYSARNGRIKKAQFHVAVSCKGKEKSENELLDFAHQWLKEMGYMESGQPLLIYSHHDTDNNHLHIVTSRVAPNGRKIDNNHERRRSQEVMDRLLKTNYKEKAAMDIKTTRQYTVSSFAQFKAVMQTLGNYEIYEKGGTVFVKQGGTVKQQFALSDISGQFVSSERDRERCLQIRNILLRYHDCVGSKEELKKEMKQKFGIELVFYGKKEAPNGYMLVDHKNKTVINGSKILATDELLDFSVPFDSFQSIEDYIDELFALKPKMAQRELNKMLRRKRACIKKGVIYWQDKTKELHPLLADLLDRNNHIKVVEMYHPRTEAEKEMLCKLLKVNQSDFVSLSFTKPKKYAESLCCLKKLFDSNEDAICLNSCSINGVFGFNKHEGIVYALDLQRHIIINLNEEGFDVSRLKWPEKQQERKRPVIKPIQKPKFRNVEGGSQSENREWEVGQKNKQEDDVGRGRGMKM